MHTTTSSNSTFHVVGMTCSHCVNAVTQEISKLDGVTRVDVDLASGSVTVESNQPVDPAVRRRCSGRSRLRDRVVNAAQRRAGFGIG